MRKETHTNWQTSPRTQPGPPSGVWDPGPQRFQPTVVSCSSSAAGSSVHPQTHSTWQRTCTTQARPAALSLPKVLKSTLQSQAFTGRGCRLDLHLPKASQKSPLGLPTQSALPGQEVAPPAPKLSPFPRWQSPAAVSSLPLREQGCPAQAPDFQVSCLTLDNASHLPGWQHHEAAGGNGPTLPAAVAPGTQTGLCHLRGRTSSARRCWLTPHLPTGRGKLSKASTGLSFRLPSPLLPSQGRTARPVTTGRPRVTQWGSRGCGSFSHLFVPRTGQERALLLGGWQLLGGQQLVGDTEGGEEAAQEGHQAGEVHGTAGTANSRRQRAHGHGHEDLRQEVLAAQQGDVNAHPAPRALRLRAYELWGHSHRVRECPRGCCALPSPGLTSRLW